MKLFLSPKQLKLRSHSRIVYLNKFEIDEVLPEGFEPTRPSLEGRTVFQ